MIDVRRAGATLVELLVSLTLLCVIGSAAVAAIRMQTATRDRIGPRVRAAAQHREGLAPLMADLSLAAARDIVAAGSADSTLAIRAVSLAGWVCAQDPSSPATLWIAAVSERGSGAGVGDSAFLYSAGQWYGTVVASVGRPAVVPAACRPRGAAEMPVVRLVVDSTATTMEGAPMRALRHVQYALYRAADGRTWLGLREWSRVQGRYATIQPIAGPFDPEGSRFVYRDAAGGPVAASAGGAIARAGLRLAAQDRRIAPAFGDSLLVALRNR